MVCHRVALFFRKARKGAVREISLFLKISLRGTWGCFSFREKQVRDGFWVLFAFSKKNQKDDFPLLFASAKSNQKQTGLRPATSVQNSERWIFWLSCKLCAYQEILREIAVLCNIARKYFEPVRNAYFTAQGVVGVYKKTKFDLSGQ